MPPIGALNGMGRTRHAPSFRLSDSFATELRRGVPRHDACDVVAVVPHKRYGCSGARSLTRSGQLQPSPSSCSRTRSWRSVARSSSGPFGLSCGGGWSRTNDGSRCSREDGPSSVRARWGEDRPGRLRGRGGSVFSHAGRAVTISSTGGREKHSRKVRDRRLPVHRFHRRHHRSSEPVASFRVTPQGLDQLRNGRAGEGFLPGAAAALRTGSGTPLHWARSWRTRLARPSRSCDRNRRDLRNDRADPNLAAAVPGGSWEARRSHEAAVTPAPRLRIIRSRPIVRFSSGKISTSDKRARMSVRPRPRSSECSRPCDPHRPALVTSIRMGSGTTRPTIVTGSAAFWIPLAAASCAANRIASRSSFTPAASSQRVRRWRKSRSVPGSAGSVAVKGPPPRSSRPVRRRSSSPQGFRSRRDALELSEHAGDFEGHRDDRRRPELQSERDARDRVLHGQCREGRTGSRSRRSRHSEVATTRRFSTTSVESKSRARSRAATSCSPVKLTTATRFPGFSSSMF